MDFVPVIAVVGGAGCLIAVGLTVYFWKKRLVIGYTCTYCFVFYKLLEKVGT